MWEEGRCVRGGEAYGRREETYVLSEKGAKFAVLRDKQFLDKKCGAERKCWLGDGYS